MKPMIKFGVFGDVQYSDLATHNPELRPAQLGVKKLTEAMNDFNDKSLDFVINLGDIIDRDARSFGPILKVVATSKSPVWHMLGNHDFCGPDYDYGHSQEAFNALRLNSDSRYYFHDLQSWRFILLDTNEVGTIEHKPDSKEWRSGQRLIERLEADGRINAKPWNGGVSETQIKWLAQKIDEAAARQLKVIVLGHHGIYPEHRENLLNDRELLDLLAKKLSVKAYINGHNHDGNYGVYKGLPCWTIEGMMDFPNLTAYATAELFDNKMIIHGYGRVKSRTIRFR